MFAVSSSGSLLLSHVLVKRFWDMAFEIERGMFISFSMALEILLRVAGTS